jgi:RNA polymerase sigma-70 factor (ECF subfamily)
VRRTQEAREIAFNRLFTEHYALVVRYAERRLYDKELARDIAGETFRVAWEKIDPDAPMDVRWLYRTASHKIMNHRSREENRRAASAAMQRLVDEPGSRIDELDRIAVREALLELKPREREALILTVWEGLDVDDVAVILDCSIGAVWKLLSRARHSARKLLAPLDSDEEECNAERRTA